MMRIITKYNNNERGSSVKIIIIIMIIYISIKINYALSPNNRETQSLLIHAAPIMI